MGFLSGNRPLKKRKYRRKGAHEPEHAKKVKTSPSAESLRLDHLPAEILQLIFVYSLNFELAQSSQLILSKLSGSIAYLSGEIMKQSIENLESTSGEEETEGVQVEVPRSELDSQVTTVSARENGDNDLNNVQTRSELNTSDQSKQLACIPGYFVNYRFITAELLQKFSVSILSDSRFLCLPPINERKIRIALYLLSHGPTSLSDSSILIRGIELGLFSEVADMLHISPRRAHCDYFCLFAAIKAGQHDLADTIINSDTFDGEDITMWKKIISDKLTNVMMYLSSEGYQPPAEALIKL